MDDTPFINDGADTSLRKVVSLLNKIEAKTGSTEITGPVTVSNEVEVTNDDGNPLPVSGTVTANGYDIANGSYAPIPLNDGAYAVNVRVEETNGSLPISGTVTATQSTASDLKAQSQLLDSTGTLVDYATIGTAGTPSADVVSVQGVSGGVGIPTLPSASSIADGIQNYLDNYGNSIPVSGTFWQTTQPVSIASAISQKVQGWDIPIHDYRGLGYTSGNLTSVTYKEGGASGTTVATLTLGYDGSGNLTSVTKT